MLLRRVVVIGGAAALTGVGAVEMIPQVFAGNGLTALAVFMLMLFAALFAWIALSFTSAVAGFCSLVARRRTAAGVLAPIRRCRDWPRAPRC